MNAALAGLPHGGSQDESSRRWHVSRGRLSLRRGLPLREGLLAAFRAILNTARRAASAAPEHPIEAVHEYRKSIRRARAIVALLRPALGRRASEGIAIGLEEAFGKTGGLRDEDILLAALTSLGEEDPATTALRGLLTSERVAQRTPAETHELLRDGAAGLRPLPGVLGTVLDPGYSIGHLQQGLGRTQRRAQRALSEVVGSYSEEGFHRWRRRMKDLRYQVELLASGGSALSRQREKELGRLARDLGLVTDLFVLRREVEARSAALPDAAGLLARIRGRSEEGARELISRGEQLLAESPRRFADRVLAERG